MTAIGSIQSGKKRKASKKATSAVFLPFGTNIKANPPKKEKLMFCQLCLSHLTKKATQKKQKLAKGTRENAHMNSAVVE